MPDHVTAITFAILAVIVIATVIVLGLTIAEFYQAARRYLIPRPNAINNYTAQRRKREGRG